MASQKPNAPDNEDRTEQFVRLWSKSARRVHSYILTLVPQPSDADDIFQEVGAVLWRKFEEYEPGSNFVAWARRTAYNKVLQFYQQRRQAPSLLDTQFIDVIDELATEQSADLERRYEALADCLNSLGERDRQMIELRYSPDSTTRGIAEQTGRTVAAVYKSLSRVHHSLLVCIESRLEQEDES